jgi:hypothetical protein
MPTTYTIDDLLKGAPPDIAAAYTDAIGRFRRRLLAVPATVQALHSVTDPDTVATIFNATREVVRSMDVELAAVAAATETVVMSSDIPEADKEAIIRLANLRADNAVENCTKMIDAAEVLLRDLGNSNLPPRPTSALS